VILDQSEPSFIAETSFVRAPLNSRVSSIGAAPKVKGKAKQESLDRVPLEIQEAMLLEDLLYVLIVSFDVLHVSCTTE
jgi:gamma-tubulin complex component 2